MKTQKLFRARRARVDVEGGCEPTRFGWRCSNLEERWAAAQMALYEEQQQELERDEDRALRLAGDCERCREPQEGQLEVVGGEALCDECIRWEREQCGS